MRLLTTQSSKQVTQLMFKVEKSKILTMITSFILILIWLDGSLFLTKWFTGNLLNTYFNVKSVPIVNTLDDIYNNKELLLEAQLNFLDKMKNHYGFDSSKVKELNNRFIDFENKYHERDEKFMISNIIQGKLAIISHTLSIDGYLDNWKDYRHLITVSQYKYLPDFATFIIIKFNPYVECTRYL